MGRKQRVQAREPRSRVAARLCVHGAGTTVPISLYFIFSKSIIGLFYNTKFTEKGRDLRGVGTQEALGAGGDAPVPALAARGGRRAGSWPERADSCLVPRAPVPWIWPVAAARRHLARLRLVLTLPGAATGRSGEGRGRAAAAFASEPLVLKGPWGRVRLRLAIDSGGRCISAGHRAPCPLRALGVRRVLGGRPGAPGPGAASLFRARTAAPARRAHSRSRRRGHLRAVRLALGVHGAESGRGGRGTLLPCLSEFGAPPPGRPSQLVVCPPCCTLSPVRAGHAAGPSPLRLSRGVPCSLHLRRGLLPISQLGLDPLFLRAQF